MNFLLTPEPLIQPNANMDEEQSKVASDFVDELIALRIVGTIEEGREVLRNAPMFVVPKPGQPGQWRVIADMLRGGQNACIGADPVILPRISHIIDQMYEGGYSAVADASKFFWNFTTHPEDQPYLGILHPRNNLLYREFPAPGRSVRFITVKNDEGTIHPFSGTSKSKLLVDRFPRDWI